MAYSVGKMSTKDDKGRKTKTRMKKEEGDRGG